VSTFRSEVQPYAARLETIQGELRLSRGAMTHNYEEALHHTISSAACLANWHAAMLGASNEMRPGIDVAAQPSGNPGESNTSKTSNSSGGGDG
jgi:hypothetical protein